MRIAAILLLLFVLALAAGGWAAIDSQPLVAPRAALSKAELDRAHAVLRQLDPRRLRDGDVATLNISSEDATLAANYLVSRAATGAILVAADGGQLAVDSSVAIPETPFGRYLNIHLALQQTDGLPEIEQIRVGRLPIPAALAKHSVSFAVRLLEQRAGTPLSTELVRSARFANERINVVYRWDVSTFTAIGSGLVESGLFERVMVYHDHLRALAARESGRRISLTKPLQWAFELARQRSMTNDPVAENRAALIALESLTNRRDLSTFAGRSAVAPAQSIPSISLASRRDFAQHFTLSAAMVALADPEISATLGLTKEINDSRGGSGFSFADLAADHAGTRFAELALADDAGARAIQTRLAAGVDDDDVVPATGDLDEKLTESEFKRRYGSTDDERFKRVVTTIYQRTGALPLFEPISTQEQQ
ncbi:MAG: hypothetical protein H6978_02810 [Gammaproteobacteria bacterium]|nr:hypothetical protein [Gammaproteobacteria bacterium]